MRKLWKLPWLRWGVVGAFAFAGVVALKKQFTPLSLQTIPVNREEYLKSQIDIVKLSLKQNGAIEFPALEARINSNDIHCVSFNFTTTMAFNHLQTFNRILELLHMSKDSDDLEIEKTHRKFIDDVVIYSLKYRTISSNTRTVIYLVGNAKKNTYSLVMDKDGEFDSIEFLVFINMAKEINNYGVSYKVDKGMKNGNVEKIIYSAISKIGCQVLEPRNNNSDIKDTFGSEYLRQTIEQILTTQKENNKEL